MGTALENVVIVGGGQAAATTCATLRASGYQGELVLISDEASPPYQRPPLSKAYLKGQLAPERLLIKPAAWFDKQEIDLRCGVRATAIDRKLQLLETSSGSLPYQRLVLATGSRPKNIDLPGSGLSGVFELRTIAHVDAIAGALSSGCKLVVIGAGYIGLEAAASARALGVDVTVLEYAPRVLARVTGPQISDFFQSLHQRQGVNIITHARISRIVSRGDTVSGVELADGTVLPADAVLLGVGIEPNCELAEQAGIACQNGIAVDRDARTSDPKVYAAGDCASRELVHYQRNGRLESVHNAVEQGKMAAAHILGLPRPVEDAPWFWSDQYHVKLQIAGLSDGHDQVVVRGDPESDSFALFYLRQGKLLAVDAVNAPPEFVFSRKLIKAGASPDAEQLADSATPMKDIAANLAA